MNLSTAPEALPLRAPGKSATAFRTIAEVAGDLDLPAHVLRFWESKFPQIKPLKRRGGRRYYRPEDVALLRRIRSLLYTEGYTIKGVQRLLREGGRTMPSTDDDPGDGGPALAVASATPAEAIGADPIHSDAPRPDPTIRDTARAILADLEDLRTLLRNHGF